MEYTNLGRCFSILHRRSQLFVAEACAHLHLTYSEYVVLVRLMEGDGVSQEDLAAMLFLDKAVVTRTIALLEQKGMIYREKDDRDRRVKRIYLTALAKGQQDYLLSIIDAWAEHLGKSMDKEELHFLVKGFQDAAEAACRTDIPAMVRQMKEKRGME